MPFSTAAMSSASCRLVHLCLISLVKSLTTVGSADRRWQECMFPSTSPAVERRNSRHIASTVIDGGSSIGIEFKRRRSCHVRPPFYWVLWKLTRTDHTRPCRITGSTPQSEIKDITHSLTSSDGNIKLCYVTPEKVCTFFLRLGVSIKAKISWFLQLAKSKTFANVSVFRSWDVLYS